MIKADATDAAVKLYVWICGWVKEANKETYNEVTCLTPLQNNHSLI